SAPITQVSASAWRSSRASPRHTTEPSPSLPGPLAVFVSRCSSRPRHGMPADDDQGRSSTYPSVPWTRIRCPSRISRVASSTPTTAGRPYSRAITAPWVIRPPTSVTRPAIAPNRGDQDVAGLGIGLRHVQDDSGSPFDRPGGNRQADQRTGWQVVAAVRAGDAL